jgi:hypothetical protein
VILPEITKRRKIAMYDLFRKEMLYERCPKSDTVYDVIIAGGGPAAIGAAIAAALTGAKVLILEARSQFGGTATAAMWMNFNWIFRDNEGNSRGGVCKILVDAIGKWGAPGCRPGRRRVDRLNDGGNLIIHPEYLKLVLFELFDFYKIDYSLYAPIVDVIKDGNVVRGVVTAQKEGRRTYQGKTVIDATGDGDVAYLAGCVMEDNNPDGDGWRAPITLLFALGNVDVDRFFSWYKGCGIELDGKVFSTYKDVMVYASDLGYFVPSKFVVDVGTIPNVVNINYHTTRDEYFDGIKSFDLTCVEKLGILQAIGFTCFATEHKIPGLEHCGIIRTGSYAAVRETRRLVGEYVFSEKDLLEGTVFADAIASKYGGRDGMGATPGINIRQGALYPYRSMLPREVDGLLIAGRCGSASFRGHYGGKSMGNMMVLGQAAGIAAALCAASGVKPRVLDYKLIQAKLSEIGFVF